MRYFPHLRRFVTKAIPFHRLHPAPTLVAPDDYDRGHRPLVLASQDRDLIAVYFPAGGAVTLQVSNRGYTAQWYDPRTGAVRAGRFEAYEEGLRLEAPLAHDGEGRPQDWVLTLSLVTTEGA